MRISLSFFWNNSVDKINEYVWKFVISAKNLFISETLQKMLILHLKNFYLHYCCNVSDYFTSHWTFRWRTAMADFYHDKWNFASSIEGASQRFRGYA